MIKFYFVQNVQFNIFNKIKVFKICHKQNNKIQIFKMKKTTKTILKSLTKDLNYLKFNWKTKNQNC